jgi:putative oxygen-independent coproporphyrinogen III oxidase
LKSNTQNEQRKPPQNHRTDLSNEGRPIGVYVHFPWCISKCPYCDFFSVEDRDGIPHQAYADALIGELHRRHSLLRPSQLGSIYFGGGTPSLWDAAQLERVIREVLGIFDARGDSVEITLECNPSSFDHAKCEQWKQARVNRLSLGIQSLDDRSLKYLGRAHDTRTALEALDVALGSKIGSIAADLIYGLPGRDAADSLNELRQLPIADLAHVSAYALTIEPNTPFGALARKGRLTLAPEEAVTETFVALHSELEHSGFEHYEISNYARPRHRSVHNSGYWEGRDYLGLGVAAWGTVTLRAAETDASTTKAPIRYRNTTNIKRYLRAATEAEPIVFWEQQPTGILMEKETISAPVALSERLMLGLRTREGVDLDELARQHDIEIWLSSRRRTLEKLQNRGRVRRDGARLSIPFPMWYLADGTISELI